MMMAVHCSIFFQSRSAPPQPTTPLAGLGRCSGTRRDSRGSRRPAPHTPWASRRENPRAPSRRRQRRWAAPSRRPSAAAPSVSTGTVAAAAPTACKSETRRRTCRARRHRKGRPDTLSPGSRTRRREPPQPTTTAPKCATTRHTMSCERGAGGRRSGARSLARGHVHLSHNPLLWQATDHESCSDHQHRDRLCQLRSDTETRAVAVPALRVRRHGAQHFRGGGRICRPMPDQSAEAAAPSPPDASKPLLRAASGRRRR